MSAITHRVTTGSTSNGATYPSGSFTPAANDLLLVFVTASATVDAGDVTASANGITFTKIDSALHNSSGNTTYAFVANQLVPASPSSMTVTFDCTGDSATGAIVHVASVSGMSKTGLTAIRQSTKQENQSGGTTPAPVFASSCLTGNPTLVVLGQVSGTATTAPTNWTKLGETTYSTPTIGSAYVGRDSGFTGTTITWGTNSTAFGDVAVELDTSSSGTTVSLNQAGETDTARAFDKAKVKTFGQSTETDLARPMGRVKAIALGRATETDLARAITLVTATVVPLGRAGETDTARPFGAAKAKSFGRVVEVETARSFTVHKTITLGKVSEADIARAFTVAGGADVVHLGTALEIDVARPIVVLKRFSLGRALEVDVARTITPIKAYLFYPPTVNRPVGTDPLTARYSYDRGVSVILVDGQWTEVPYPETDDLIQLVDGVSYFLGGHGPYHIDQDTAAALVAAGFQVVGDPAADDGGGDGGGGDGENLTDLTFGDGGFGDGPFGDPSDTPPSDDTFGTGLFGDGPFGDQ